MGPESHYYVESSDWKPKRSTELEHSLQCLEVETTLFLSPLLSKVVLENVCFLKNG